MLKHHDVEKKKNKENSFSSVIVLNYVLIVSEWKTKLTNISWWISISINEGQLVKQIKE